MNKSTFNSFRELIYDVSGITLNESKHALVCARVGKRMRRLGITRHEDYLKMVIGDKSGNELVHLLNAISTNVTSFFREGEHFEKLRSLLREWIDAGQRRFRFWSAACSTGAEPYTMAMSILEETGGDCDCKILATDINTKVLQTAKAAIYPKAKIQGIPPILRDKYFISRRGAGSLEYEAKAMLKKMVVFGHLNLATPPFPMKGPMDAIFCRNVMIYFDNAVRKRLLQELYALLKPGGYLFVGHAESLTGMVSNFRVVRPAVYVKEPK